MVGRQSGTRRLYPHARTFIEYWRAGSNQKPLEPASDASWSVLGASWIVLDDKASAAALAALKGETLS